MLEIGAGNGYLARLVGKAHSGRQPSNFVITDASATLLDLARRRYPVPGAEYLVLDLRRPFPLDVSSVDVVVSVMVFNELGNRALANALSEIQRVLRDGGRLVGAALHPDFARDLFRRGKVRPGRPSTIPGPGRLRLPVVKRSIEAYDVAFSEAGLTLTRMDVHATEEVLNEKSGLRHLRRGIPIAFTFEAIA